MAVLAMVGRPVGGGVPVAWVVPEVVTVEASGEASEEVAKAAETGDSEVLLGRGQTRTQRRHSPAYRPHA